MYQVAVLGDRDSVMGYRALGMTVVAVDDAAEAAQLIEQLADDHYAVIFLTEAIAEAKETGKNEEIAAKMAEGKVRKYLEENTLLNQKYVLDEQKTVREILGGVNVRRFVRYTLGG